MTLTLRPYQRKSLDALYGYWETERGSPLIVLPTGAGKSLVIAKMVEELLAQFPDLRVAIVTHSKELIVQNYRELIGLWPAAPAGIYSASVGRRETHSRILFCGVQSVYNKVDLIGPRDLIIVDEAHLIPRDSSTMYGKFFANMAEITADMRVCGLTATPYRMDSGLLAEGPGAMFDRIVYEANVGDLIEGEYLSPLISKASAAQIDLNGIGTRAGDFISSDMERAAMADGLVERAVAELVAYGQDRRAWLAFCSGVDHATAVRDAIRAHGIAAETVHGAMKQGERNGVIERFRRGEIRCLTSVNVLSIGFNVPHVDLVALMRGTKSTGMYVQQVGRGFRRAPGKENALILDFASVIRMHGPVDAVSVLPKKKGAKGETEKVTVNDVRAKECPDCESLAALNARTCKVCGHEWQIEVKPSHEAEADATTGILSSEKVPPQSIPVLRWDWKRWKKEGSPDSVRITYVAGLNTYIEWVCPEHGGRAGEKAANWWSEHGGDMPPPRDADEALERRGEATLPATITVRPAKHNPRYFDIVGRSFAAAQGRAA
ncbi:DNA repair protein RadD [Fulvimarina manganoxydans]|uniref:DNA repair protein RadD n=1 Tax=Fulvimarina manganoxydans TaxID=937218 RepID=A0A1W1Z2Y1_9HYPH|nr:DEAD/DEAH box helicase [Fulvimarina manganoxydans]SMC42746.1 DNA repair protein RadD [Fulvimarina manganoxydans]